MEAERQWLRHFNTVHPYLRISPDLLESVFLTIEQVVRDREVARPDLDTVLLMSDAAAPREVIEALFKYWRSRPRVDGSVLRWREWPPDVDEWRKKYREYFRQAVAPAKRKPGSPAYVNWLRVQERVLAEKIILARGQLDLEVANLEETQHRIRAVLRSLRDRVGPGSFIGHLPFEAPPASVQKLLSHEDNADLVAYPTSLPRPRQPAFLQWCYEQKKAEIPRPPPE
jgi:hypothetical protein